MSAGGGNSSEELNLAPIIDCFTVLIAYMLASASFLSLGVFDAGVAVTPTVAAIAPPADPNKPPELAMMLQVKPDKSIAMTLSGAEKAVIDVPPGALKAEIEKVRLRAPALTGATLTAQDAVEYENVMKVVELLKELGLKVFLKAS